MDCYQVYFAYISLTDSYSYKILEKTRLKHVLFDACLSSLFFKDGFRGYKSKKVNIIYCIKCVVKKSKLLFYRNNVLLLTIFFFSIKNTEVLITTTSQQRILLP